MDFLSYWGHWIGAQRKASGDTLEAFAKRTNISSNQIYHIERGQADSRKETLDKIFSVLDENMGYDAITSFVELDIHQYKPLIHALEQLDPQTRSAEIQQLLNIIS